MTIKNSWIVEIKVYHVNFRSFRIVFYQNTQWFPWIPVYSSRNCSLPRHNPHRQKVILWKHFLALILRRDWSIQQNQAGWKHKNASKIKIKPEVKDADDVVQGMNFTQILRQLGHTSSKPGDFSKRLFELFVTFLLLIVVQKMRILFCFSYTIHTAVFRKFGGQSTLYRFVWGPQPIVRTYDGS